MSKDFRGVAYCRVSENSGRQKSPRGGRGSTVAHGLAAAAASVDKADDTCKKSEYYSKHMHHTGN